MRPKPGPPVREGKASEWRCLILESTPPIPTLRRIIAAADNGFGIIGVAPQAEIVPVQVLRRPTGLGDLGAVIAGIVYAADIDADVINMSLAFDFFHSGGVDDQGTEQPNDDTVYTADEAAVLMVAVNRATSYAHARGSTIITGTANQAIDGNHDRDAFYLPRDSQHLITVGGTGPLGWAIDPSGSLDIPAVFSNYGQSIVELSAPSGNLDWDLIASNVLCTVTSGPLSVTYPCWFFDSVVSTAPVAGGSVRVPCGHQPGLGARVRRRRVDHRKKRRRDESRARESTPACVR